MFPMLFRLSLLSLLPLLTLGFASAQANFNLPNDTQSTGVSSGFGENNSTAFNLGGPGWSFSNNLNVSSSVGTPFVGQGMSTGIGFVGNGLHGSLGLNLAQGSSQFMGGTTQSLTTSNGVPGYVQVGEFVPFVTGVTPIVGGNGVGYGPVVTTYPDPYGNAAAMMSQSNAIVMNNAMANQAQWNQTRLQLYMRRAEMAMKDRDIKRARANLALAAGYAPQPLKAQLQNQLKTLKLQK